MTLSLHDIASVRGGRMLFRDLTLELGAGEILLVRGPNGSGKSSLLRLIAGLLRPAAGKVGWSEASEETPLQSQLHYLGHLDALKPALSVREMLGFWCAMLGGSKTPDAAIEAWHLERLAELPCGVLSAGQRRRAALAQLALTSRPLWLLDEPTAPLDKAGVELVTGAIRRHCHGGGTVIIATHRPLDAGASRTLDLGAGDLAL